MTRLVERQPKGCFACGTLARMASCLLLSSSLVALVGCGSNESTSAAAFSADRAAAPQAFQPMPAATPIDQAHDDRYASPSIDSYDWRRHAQTAPSAPNAQVPRVNVMRNWPEDTTAPSRPVATRPNEQIPIEESAAATERPGQSTVATSHETPRRWTLAADKMSETSLDQILATADAFAIPSSTRPTRGPASLAAINQAEAHYRKAFELGNRGALFAARAELLAGLRTLAEGLDIDAVAPTHSEALTSGMGALDEAEDFAPRSGPWPTEADVMRTARSHRTPVVRKSDVEVSATTAEQLYLAYTVEHLAAAVEYEPVGAQLLHGLGKTYGQLATQPSRISRGAGGKAMAFHRAALLAAPRHQLAANDLAVLLAQSGRLSDAAQWFSYSLSIQPSAAAWHNLSVVQAQLGQAQAAQQSERAALAASKGSRAMTEPAVAPWLGVRWLNPASFADTSLPATDPRLNTPASSAAPATAASRPPAPRPEVREARRTFWNN